MDDNVIPFPGMKKETEAKVIPLYDQDEEQEFPQVNAERDWREK